MKKNQTVVSLMVEGGGGGPCQCQKAYVVKVVELQQLFPGRNRVGVGVLCPTQG